MGKTNENTKNIYQQYAMPPCQSRFFHLGSADGSHFAESGETLYAVTRNCLGEPSRRGYRATVTNTGIAPRNTEYEKYAPGAIRYASNFLFNAGELVTAGLLVGSLNTSSDEGRAQIAALVESEKILDVGRLAPGGYGWLTFEFSPEGIDYLFSVDEIARSRMILKMDGPGSEAVKDGALYILARNSYFSSCRPSPAPAGWLLPSCIVDDVPAAAHPAGTVENGWPVLTAAVREYYRGLAVIEADCYARADDRGNCAQMTSEQSACLDVLLDAACTAAPVEVEVQG
jgi:hypothetical protein